MTRYVMMCSLVLLSTPANGLAQSCVGNPVAVQILGSGGPGTAATALVTQNASNASVNHDRASTSYLLWVGAQAKVLVDMGGGAFLRFGQAQAKLGDLSMVAISHLHPDHVSDLPALLWLSQSIRQDPLPIFGPSGNEVAPNFSMFLSRLFDETNGAFPLLGATLGGTRFPTSEPRRSQQGDLGGSVRLSVGVVDVTKAEPSTVFDRQGVTVTALGIPHGHLPTLAYRVHTRDVSVVFSSDQTGTNPRFIEFAKGANVLIMHLMIEAGGTSPLHASPSVVGRVAHDAGVGRLIVSHIGQFDLDAAIAELKKFYTGPLTIGVDLQCTPVE
jgi:ribonuclease BN (tRNA processing enzyme)